jgi:pimeloyl-ACP methyl ester carboxylesterase
MNTVLWALLVFVAVGAGLWLVSFALEALRKAPPLPARLRWAPDLKIEHVNVGGSRLRYIKTGKGPTLVLLHTLRTQLDLFEKVIPELSKHFTVYALDYPGHGHSDIPNARYDAAFFTKAVEGFLEALDLRHVTLAGVSIGGSIVLIVAARQNPRVDRVVAINPYDYAKGRGMARSSIAGRLVNYTALIPFIGETVMRMRNLMVMKMIFEGGVADAKSIPPALLKEMYLTGNRPGHYRAFLKLLRNSQSWEIATKDYGRIAVPVLLIWGDRDWAKPAEREHDRSIIPNVEMITVKHGGHFLPLDKPQEVIRAILDFTPKAARAT